MFKVGDKVKLIKRQDDWITDEIGVVSAVFSNSVHVKFPDRCWNCSLKNVELLKKTVKCMNEYYKKLCLK